MSLGRLRIRAGFVLLLSFLVFFDEGMLLWIVWTAALLHEAGHYGALRLAGGRMESLELHGGGITMTQASWPPMSYGGELLAVAAGPAASFICALLFTRLDDILKEAASLSGMCLSHGIFNLLPAKGLDGGRFLTLLLERSNKTNPRPILLATTLCSVLLIAAAGGWYVAVTKSAVVFLTTIAVISTILLGLAERDGRYGRYHK